jgi:hypothetical protein
MDPKRSQDSTPPKAETEYRADASKVIAHAAESVAPSSRADGNPRFMIAIPPAEPGSESTD